MQAMERGGVSPDKGPVLVSGATGGVGGVATIILSQVAAIVIGNFYKHRSLIDLAICSWVIMWWLWVD